MNKTKKQRPKQLAKTKFSCAVFCYPRNQTVGTYFWENGKITMGEWGVNLRTAAECAPLALETILAAFWVPSDSRCPQRLESPSSWYFGLIVWRHAQAAHSQASEPQSSFVSKCTEDSWASSLVKCRTMRLRRRCNWSEN